MLRSMEILLFKNFRGLNRNKNNMSKNVLFRLMNFWVLFGPIPTKKCNYLQIDDWIPGLVIVQFFKPFYATK